MSTTLYKPAGLPVFRPHADAGGDCLLARLLGDQPWRSGIDWPRGFECGIAHRLDNATSGAILVADDLGELAQFREWFAAHRFIKTYLLLAGGVVSWTRRRCDLPLAHHAKKKSRMVVQASVSTPHRGKWYPAQTTFRRIRGRLFEASMSTGVTHQIRVHAAHVGIPILGDVLYAPKAAGVGKRTIVAINRKPGEGRAAQHPPTTASANEMRASFYLHHIGLKGPGGVKTGPVLLPDWTDAYKNRV